MLQLLRRQSLSFFLIPFLFVGMMISTSCVKYTAVSFDEVKSDLKEYSPDVRVTEKNGEAYDILVTEFSDKTLKGYSSTNESTQQYEIPVSTIEGLSVKEDTKLKKVTKGVLASLAVGGLVFLWFKSGLGSTGSTDGFDYGNSSH